MARIHLGAVVLSLSIAGSAVAVGLAACDSGDTSPAVAETVAPTGCPPAGGAALPPTAPDGYYVNGNTVCTPEGKPHLLHGVDRPSLERNPLSDHVSPGGEQAAPPPRGRPPLAGVEPPGREPVVRRLRRHGRLERQRGARRL